MRLIACLLALLPTLTLAQSPGEVIARTIDAHILPRYATLAEGTAELHRAAQDDCSPTDPALRRAYGAAFDAWIAVSHLRFGPSEADDRAFALAFWPDTRGATPKVLGALITASDPVADTVAGYAQVSIAARGFYALEFLLYDPAFRDMGAAAYRCALIRTVTGDIAAQAAGIHADWQGGYGAEMKAPDPDGPYRSEAEALRQLYGALTTGLEFTAAVRLGRPLGTFERPRPLRAEARRAGRSARHVALSLASLADLAQHLSAAEPAVQAMLAGEFARTEALVATLDDPVFAGVSDPGSRLRVEVVQQAVQGIEIAVKQALGPALGVTAGFNALDGD